MSFPFGHCDTVLGGFFASTAGFFFGYITPSPLCSLRTMSLSLGKGPKTTCTLWRVFLNDCFLLAGAWRLRVERGGEGHRQPSPAGAQSGDDSVG